MAILQEKINQQGVTGNYWRIIQYNNNTDREDSVVTLGLYLSQASRLAGNSSGLDSVQFVFIPNDHPLSDFDVDTIQYNTYETFPELEVHIRYTHIVNIANIANDKIIAGGLVEELTSNEQKALFFFGGVEV